MTSSGAAAPTRPPSRDIPGGLHNGTPTRGSIHYLLAVLMFLLLVAGAVFFLSYVDTVITDTAVSSYQTNEMEIVRGTARAIEDYVTVQTVVLGREDITEIEQEVFTRYVEPVQLLENGDAWIYAPDHIVFDRSADLPPEYWGKSMAEIFALQAANGASHYEEMTADVGSAREGYGYYTWLPAKGKEIAAWTPVKVANYTWTIGLSTPLAEILDASGASSQMALITVATVFFLLLALVLLLVWMYTDLSRRRAEADLKRSRNLYRTLAESSPDMIYLIDRDGRVRYASPRAAAVFRRTPEDLVGKGLDAIFPPDVCRHHMNEINGVIRTGEPRQLEVVEPHPDGEHWISVRLSPVTGAGGGVTAVLGISTDITAEKRAEAALAESEERYRQLFEQAGDCIMVLDAEGEERGRIIAANANAAAMHGYTVAELLTMNIADLDTPESGREIDERFRLLLANRRLTGEATHVRKDGSEFPIDINAGLLTIGTQRYILAIDRDISERKAREKALKIAGKKLEVMNIVTWHDIQNKISGLRGYISLSWDMIGDPEVRKYLEKEEYILADIERQIRNTREYQEMGVRATTWVDIPRTVREVLAFRASCPVAVRVELPPLRVLCDPIIDRVFSHLVDNTIEHGVHATEVRISCHETPEGLTIVYEDNGAGIPPEKRATLFSAEVAKISGFSLVFIHDLLDLSGMGIRETGSPGKGARFEITVPKGMYRFGSPDNEREKGMGGGDDVHP